MKKAEFKRVVLKADDYDRFVFAFIVNRFDYFDGYYGHFFSIQPELRYKEFTTLKDDLKQYHTEVISIHKDVDVKQIQSLKRSCELLKGKINVSKSVRRSEFTMFLDYCIQNLDSMVDKFIDEILVQLK